MNGGLDRNRRSEGGQRIDGVELDRILKRSLYSVIGLQPPELADCPNL
jgi:hypothetical protein